MLVCVSHIYMYWLASTNKYLKNCDFELVPFPKKQSNMHRDLLTLIRPIKYSKGRNILTRLYVYRKNNKPSKTGVIGHSHVGQKMDGV